MNAATTRWLVGIALALLLYLVIFDRRTTNTKDFLDARDRVLPALNLDTVDGIEVRNATNVHLKLVRTEGEWRLTEPLPYPAQATSVERFLTALRDLRFRGRIRANEVLAQTNGLAAFGLKPPAASIILTAGDQRTEIRLGARTPIGGQVYLQVVGADDLLAVPDAFLRVLPASSFAWRHTALLVGGLPDFDRFSVLPVTNGFEVVRAPDGHAWKMVRPLTAPADGPRLEYLFHQLELAQVAQFVTDQPGDQLARYGLAPPVRELVFARGEEPLFQLQIGRGATNHRDFVYVRNARLGNVMLAGRKLIEPWLASYRDFCDRRLMVFALPEVRRIEFRADEEVALDRGTNDTWRIVRPVAAPADTVLVLEFLARLAGWEFMDFEREVVTDFAPYGLDPPLREYRVLGAPTNAPPNATNRVLARVRLGKPRGNLYLARRGNENAVVTVVDDGRLPRAAWQLRSRQIWNFSTNQIVDITVHQQGATKKLIRRGPMNWVAAEGSPAKFNPLTIEETAYRLGRLYADRWVARGAERLPLYGFPKTAYRVEVTLKNGDRTETRTLFLGRRGPKGKRYAAVQLADPPGWVIFELPLPIQAFIEGDLLVAPLP
jgi:hypothetical protein